MDTQKIDNVLKKITRYAKHKEFRSNLEAILAYRLFTLDSITNKDVARYVWDLHQMNYN